MVKAIPRVKVLYGVTIWGQQWGVGRSLGRVGEDIGQDVGHVSVQGGGSPYSSAGLAIDIDRQEATASG